MTKEVAPRIRDLRFYSCVLATIWAVFVFGMMLWGISRVNETTGMLANEVAKAHFDKDQAFRLWATSHGGVYVPIDARTPPNPYLEQVPERDVRTRSGKDLTLMNPAYMLRQLHEDFAELYGIKGHITSLKPLRPENHPDEWEKKALESFETGTTQESEYAEIEGKPYLRLIRPVLAGKDCLKCHNNYREGDIRGGVGVALPMDNFLEARASEITTLIVSHGSIFVIGLLGIGFGTRRLEQRKREGDSAQEALRASEKKYRSLFDHSKDGVFITSREGELIEANKSLVDMFGYTAEEMIGMDVRQLYSDSSERDKFRDTIEGARSVNGYEASFCRKEGTLIHCVLTAQVRLSEDGSVVGYQGIVRDVTDQKRAEEALRNQSKELERSNLDLEQFAYIASHDLQEPLRNVATCLQMLERDYKNKLDPNADQYIQYAVESAVQMKALILDLLAYSRVATRGKPPEKTDCEQIFERALKNLSCAITETGAVITHDALPTISADDTQLLQVFQNLIQNAIKFRKDEPPQIHVSALKSKKEWIFFVKDNGIGIESHQLDRIFQIFHRLHKRSDYNGTGIGLAIAKKVVERHGGRIWAESELGSGTTFHFTIPDKEIRT